MGFPSIRIAKADFRDSECLNERRPSIAESYYMSVTSWLFNQLGRIPRRPRILLLVDYRGWAFDNSAQEIAQELSSDFEFDIRYVNDSPKPKLKAKQYDLIYVFFWGETYHQQFGFKPSRTIKEVSSHRWEDDPRFGPCSAEEMVKKYLQDAETVICTSERLCRIIEPYCARTFLTPNGICTDKFHCLNERSGALTFGWAGNISDPVKGVHDILQPACEGLVELQMAPGGVSHDQMNAFYNQLDVFLVASRHEGEPLTLVEAMAAGCFPVCSNVGIVPELIQHEVNGLIVEPRTPEAFRDALKWCQENQQLVRRAALENSVSVSSDRKWRTMALCFKKVFEATLLHAKLE